MEKFNQLVKVVNKIARCQNCLYLIPSSGPFDGVCTNPLTNQYPKINVFKDMSCEDFKGNEKAEILLREYHNKLFNFSENKIINRRFNG